MVKTQECFVAFLDIMGFASFVKSEDSDDVRKYLSDFVNVAHTLNIKQLDLNIKIFSDSIIVSQPVKGVIHEFYNFLLYMNALQLMVIVEEKLGKLPLRGAIVKGDFYTDNSDLIFGRALIEAVEKESTIAIYPRIVVAHDELQPEKQKQAIEILKKVGGSFSKYTESPGALRRDFDGLLHCNYLSSTYLVGKGWSESAEAGIKKHREIIIRNLEKKNSSKIEAKFHWMRSYHNWFCTEHKEFQGFTIKDDIFIKN